VTIELDDEFVEQLLRSLRHAIRLAFSVRVVKFVEVPDE
jgi:hypothetical protein